jgi:hypothetical protein
VALNPLGGWHYDCQNALQPWRSAASMISPGVNVARCHLIQEGALSNRAGKSAHAINPCAGATACEPGKTA